MRLARTAGGGGERLQQPLAREDGGSTAGPGGSLQPLGTGVPSVCRPGPPRALPVDVRLRRSPHGWGLDFHIA